MPCNGNGEKITLDTAVKEAALELGEDYSRVKATFTQLAFSVYRKLVNTTYRTPAKRVLLDVHKNLNSVKLPNDFKEDIFIGIIDNCDKKLALRNNTEILAQVDYTPCIETCSECNQPKDICENLNTEEITESKTILGNSYIKKTYKKYKNGTYFLEVHDWILNIDSNIVEEFITKEFITEFDTNKCGCIKNTEENLEKVKKFCNSCYDTCYNWCNSTCLNVCDNGGYKIIDGYIYIDKAIKIEKLYLEYRGDMQKVDGEWVIPDILLEVIKAGIKLKYRQDRLNIPEIEKRRLKSVYEEELADMKKYRRRISLYDIEQMLK